MSIELGALIDGLYALRQQRLELDKQVKTMKAQEADIRFQIMEPLDNSGLARASGLVATSGITTSMEPEVLDWDAVHTFIRVENRFDLLQKRLSAPAWRERCENGILVPGTTPVTTRDLSLTKATR